jgi:hypothetical protein
MADQGTRRLNGIVPIIEEAGENYDSGYKIGITPPGRSVL